MGILYLYMHIQRCPQNLGTNIMMAKLLFRLKASSVTALQWYCLPSNEQYYNYVIGCLLNIHSAVLQVFDWLYFRSAV